jgi:hypothetical protein
MRGTCGVRKLFKWAHFALYHGSTVSSAPQFDVLTFGTRKGVLSSQVLVTKSENTSIGGLVVEDSTANIQLKQWRYRRKPRKHMHTVTFITD